MRHTISLFGLIALSSVLLAQNPPTATGATLARMDAPLAEFKKKKTDDWSKLLPDLLLAIQKCVNDGHVAVLYIVKSMAHEPRDGWGPTASVAQPATRLHRHEERDAARFNAAGGRA